MTNPLDERSQTHSGQPGIHHADLLLMSIWYGWKAVTLGLIPGSLGPFILYGAVSIATGWAGLSKVDLHVKRTNE